ncbi:MAG: hypothetical protein ACOYEV_18640, partial [Candidatus Nanopelagicales bacterium]
PAGEPKPAKPAKVKKPRGKNKRAEADAGVESDVETLEVEATETETVADDTVEVVETEREPSSEAADESVVAAEDPAATGGLRNKRPTGKSRNRLRR